MNTEFVQAYEKSEAPGREEEEEQTEQFTNHRLQQYISLNRPCSLSLLRNAIAILSYPAARSIMPTCFATTYSYPINEPRPLIFTRARPFLSLRKL
jgi:hypothetical protein